MEKICFQSQKGCTKQSPCQGRKVKQIDVLPHDVLLEIFYSYVDMYPFNGKKPEVEAWQVLVHVCQRWRSLVLGSPRHLNLRLYCTPKTPAKDTLDVMPALPLIVEGGMILPSDTDNIVAALRQSNRVCEVSLRDLTGLQLGEVLAAMQVSFPELTEINMDLQSESDETIPVILGSFLGGFAPRLERFHLHNIPSPEVPNLLLSATHLVHLVLDGIPPSGYISPDAMAALFSVLSSLKLFSLKFRTSQSRPGWESQSLHPERPILPVLTEFYFKGVTGYFKDLVTFDAPQLRALDITFFDQTDFHCPRLAQFISRTPTLRKFEEAHVRFNDTTTFVELRCRTFGRNFRWQDEINDLVLTILCTEPNLQLSSIAQVCNSSLLPPNAVEDLYIEDQSQQVWTNGSNGSDAIVVPEWLDLLLPFTAVKNLYLCEDSASEIAVVLRELIGSRITEVLPNLQNIFVEGLQDWSLESLENTCIWEFAGARQQSGHPIVISEWVEGPDKELMSRSS